MVDELHSGASVAVYNFVPDKGLFAGHTYEFRLTVGGEQTQLMEYAAQMCIRDRLKIDKMFTRLLTGFPGNNNFILTVTENNGLSTTKTLKYYVPAN